MVEMLCVPFVIQCKFPQFGFHWLIKAFAMEQETLANQVIYLVGDQWKLLENTGFGELIQLLLY